MPVARGKWTCKLQGRSKLIEKAFQVSGFALAASPRHNDDSLPLTACGYVITAYYRFWN